MRNRFLAVCAEFEKHDPPRTPGFQSWLDDLDFDIPDFDV